MIMLKTGSQKVEGSNPSSSTKEVNTANTSSNYLSTSSNSYMRLAIPLERLIEGFLLSCKVENKSPATISFYKNILDKFQWYLDKYCIDTIDATAIRKFLVYLKDTPNRWDSSNTRANRPVAPITVRSYYSGLSALFTWSMEEELIETNPMANVKKPQLPHKTVKGLEPDIIHKLLNSITNKSLQALRNKAILYMFLDTGLRLSELTNLTISDISMNKDIIRVGNKERYVRIGIKTQKALWNYLAHRPVDVEHVWLGKGNAPFTVDGVAQMIRNFGKSHGIKLSPHKLRHSFAISFLRNGANPFELQIALGHTTLEMTRRYTQALGFEDVFKRHILASPVDRLIR
ncbi:tyrosine-type recombinase/integrase [Chloroflexota bacterium]